jgi:hypothetical protein
MENNDLQNIWKNINSEISQKSKDELNHLLSNKTRKAMNKFLYVTGFAIAVCVGLLIFLTITALNRSTDELYQINNISLGVITIIALISSLNKWYLLQNNRYNQPLKYWLDERINSLSKELTGRFSKLYLFLLPILYTLTTLSIHVYFENKPFVEVLQTEESVIGLIVGAIFGLTTSYIGSIKIRKYYKKNLEELKELHGLL